MKCKVGIAFIEYDKFLHQWHGGSEAAGEAARLMALPPVIFFLPLGLGRVLGTRIMS